MTKRELWNIIMGMMCLATGIEALWHGAKYEGLNLIIFSNIFLELNKLKAGDGVA